MSAAELVRAARLRLECAERDRRRLSPDRETRDRRDRAVRDAEAALWAARRAALDVPDEPTVEPLRYGDHRLLAVRNGGAL